jgi:hypothetical protein
MAPTTVTNREHIRTLPNGLKLYRVKLVGGPANGQRSVCSHDTVWLAGEKYVRGRDDLYYHEPKAGGKQ